MHQLTRSVSLLTGLALFSSLAFSGPLISVSPGLLYTAASGTNNTLAGDPDTGGSGIPPSFNGVAYWNSPTNGPTLYVSDSAKHKVFRVVLNTGQVTTFAGTGGAGYSGDGGPATSAQLQEPAGLVVDSDGNVFIADITQSVIRRVDTAGTITTYAGTGTGGFSGDGGAATSAQLFRPAGLAIDSSKNLYIADTVNGRIRMVAAGSNTITTVAGGGSATSPGDGPATSVSLMLPTGVAVDSTGANVYLSDTGHHLVRRVSGGNLVTIAGGLNSAGYIGDNGPGTSALLNTPYGVAVDAGGAVYVSDLANHIIRKVASNGIITTIAGQPGSPSYKGDGGPALTGNLSSPSFLTSDLATGNLFFVDSGNKAVRSVTAAASAITFPLTAVGSSASTSITISNVGDQTLTITGASFPTNFTAGTGGTCSSTTPSISPGQSCTMTLTFTPTSGGPTSGTLAFTTGTSGVSANVVLSQSNGLRFVPVTPCRVVDTRMSDPTFGGGAFSAGETRSYDLRNSTSVGCASAPVASGADVQAYSLNVTVVPRGTLPYVTIFPAGTSRPNVSTLNAYDGRIKANAAIVPVLPSDRRVSVYAQNATDVVLDINGYYVPETDTTALAYYPVPPCRVSDTRWANVSGGLGGPFLQGGGKVTPGQNVQGRSIPIRSSSCSLPSNAQAYSLNITAVPRAGTLDWLTLWPSDKSTPFVSTLNSPTGTTVANAAIVPASAADGSISAYATQDIELIIDVNGYYAPASPGGLSLYNVTPCRAFDTRGTSLTNPPPPAGVSTQNVASACSVSGVAQSYVLNATVLPTGSLIYMTNWAHGTAQSLQSTLNAYDGAVSSNLAIVPTIDGSVSSYTTVSTGLILDLFGYFAP